MVQRGAQSDRGRGRGEQGDQRWASNTVRSACQHACQPEHSRDEAGSPRDFRRARRSFLHNDPWRANIAYRTRVAGASDRSTR